jgi:two-component system LytT family response regulator
MSSRRRWLELIKAIVVDDEQPSLHKLGKLLKDSGLAEVKGTFTEPLAALAFLKENKADAVFLDIEMPEIDGIELSNHIIDLQAEIAVVFVTAYNQYAVEAFRLNALDYLMKPVAADRLRETLCRIIKEKGIAVNSEVVHVCCFGGFSVDIGGKEVKFRTEKAEELLAFLIDRKGAFVSRIEIIDNLWENFDGDRALIHFNTTLHYVKKALLPYGVHISILHERGSYRLDGAGLSCDYMKFLEFAEKNKTAGQENILEFEEAAGLYTGEYLYGLEYDWATAGRLLLEEEFIRLVLEISWCYIEAGDRQKAVKWLKSGLQKQPLHRELNYRLIEFFLLTNERMLAVKYYEIYRSGLKKKLKTEPDDAFRKLLQ